MTNSNESNDRNDTLFRNAVDWVERVAKVTTWLFVFQTVILLLVSILLARSQFDVSADKRYAKVTDAMLDAQARLDKLDQDNQVLFRMLRYDSDQRGVIPTPLSPLPKPQPNRPGNAPGGVPGDAMGDGAFGDAAK